jgi:cold shock CspA family protein
MITGVIATFDDHRGDGMMRSDDGQLFYFHCVAIEDGSRTILVGVRAAGERHVGRLGKDELVHVITLL